MHAAQPDAQPQGLSNVGGAAIGARLLVQPPVGLPPVGAVQRDALRVDVVQRDAQLPRQHRQRVAVDARQDAAAQVRHRGQAATLQQMRAQTQ